MKTNGKYRMNRKPLSSEEINRMQDFNAVLKGASMSGPKGGNGGGGFSNWLYMTGASLLVVVGVAAWFFYPDTKEKAISRQVEQNIPETMPRTQEDSEDLVRAPLVRLPVKEWDIAFASYTLDAQKGGLILHPGGTEIRVPASCLIDDKGNTIQGPVEFRYREFFDPVEIALSGITMEYDSAGVSYYFETGGMCELRAFQHGTELKMKPEKPVEVSMPAKIDGNYNLYYLDDERGWQPKGNSKQVSNATRDNITSVPPVTESISEGEESIIEPLTPELKRIQTQINQLESQKPKAPRKANVNRPRFNLDVKLNEFPELSDFDKMQFEIAPEDKVFTTDLYKIEWNDVQLKRYSSTRYKMVLSQAGIGDSPRRVVELIVVPVIDEKDFAEAQKKYKQLLEDYNAKLEAKKAEEARLKKEAEVARNKQMEAYQQQLKNQQATVFTEQEVRHVFSMDGFGIWNNDNPRIKPKRIIQAQFVTPNKEPIQCYNAKVILPSKRALIDIHHGGNGIYGIHDVGDSKSIVLFVLPDKQIAFKRVSDLNPSDGVIIMQPDPHRFESAKEIKEYIYRTLGQ
ncbi:MAG: hypothetical protein GC180_02835 [Bacteroidetes bacterium]|nr:hypothetical protein [Bacteroidota bacterium]